MGKVIDFNERKRKKDQDRKNTPIPGFIIWLYCPTCKTVEYTEMLIPGGRIHNKCGSIVEEVEVPIDVRAEYTVSCRNLDKLENLENKNTMPKFIEKLFPAAKSWANNLISAEKEYQRRLLLIASKNISTYPDDWKPEDHNISYKVIEPFGIQLTEARIPPEDFSEPA